MGLEMYVGRRLVALPPSASVSDAGRLMRTSHVGAVVVEDHDRAVGIVTDRDLTVRVAGRGLDPVRVSLGQVMTTDVATLHVEAGDEAAAALMHELGVRRVSIGDRHVMPIGIITLVD